MARKRLAPLREVFGWLKSAGRSKDGASGVSFSSSVNNSSPNSSGDVDADRVMAANAISMASRKKSLMEPFMI